MMSLRFLFLAGLLCLAQSHQDQERLVRALMNGYMSDVDPGPIVNVQLNVALLHLALNEQNLILASNLWEHVEWIDPRLQWDPKEYGDISAVHLPSSKVWKPDIMPYNSIGLVERAEVNVVLTSVGSILWVPPAVYHTPCQPSEVSRDNVPRYTCTIKIGSWTYDGLYMNATQYGSSFVDLDSYIPSRDTLVSQSTERSVKHYPCCPEPYIDFTITLVLEPSSASGPHG